jgi:SAM-dependent methyltransferase
MAEILAPEFHGVAVEDMATRSHEIANQPDFARWNATHADKVHGLLIHNARVKLISTVLPEADVIVDLGGANGSIYEMGYPHDFDQLIIVDLPPEDRCEMYRDLPSLSCMTPQGPIHTLLSGMTDLSSIPSASVDLVWSGESIEHITEEDSKLVYAEVKRILKPEGYFCLDTPNRLMTELHIGTPEWIHPEHKIEYYPEHLQRNLREAGFDIMEQLGVVEMVNTSRTGKIDYRDFYVGAGLSLSLERSYIQFYRCKVHFDCLNEEEPARITQAGRRPFDTTLKALPGDRRRPEAWG